MKYLFRATIIFVATKNVSAYIEESTAGRKSQPFATTDWSPQSFTPKIRIRPLGEPEIEEEKINVDRNADGIIRREYSAWTKRYGKVRDEKRFQIFKKNFVTQMEMNRKNGKFYLLNEFGDLTKEEYISVLQKGPNERGKNEVDYIGSSSTLPPAPIPRLEDLTKELLDSVMESSRKFVAEERNEIKDRKEILEMGTINSRLPNFHSTMAAERKEKTESKKKNVRLPSFHSSITGERKESTETKRKNIRLPNYHFSSTVGKKESTETKNVNGRAPGLHFSIGGKQYNVITEEFSNTEVFEATPIFTSYSDVLNAPMKPLDNLTRYPTLMCAALTSASETFKGHLIDGKETSFEDNLNWEEHAYAMDFGGSNEYSNCDNYNGFASDSEAESEVYGGDGEFSGWYY